MSAASRLVRPSATCTGRTRWTKRSTPDGTKLSDLDIPGWARLRQEILDRARPIIQYGIANGRFPQRKQLLTEQRPDMVSVCHNAHDEGE
jgi:3-keto-5-aminohexanoate cleavage enzyme